jgi:hypothetical protein
MNSIEKIHELAREYQGAPDPEAPPLELALRTAVMTVGPLFLELLPDDAQELDEGLEEMALKLLSLCSDGRPAPQILIGERRLALEAGADA